MATWRLMLAAILMVLFSSASLAGVDVEPCASEYNEMTHGASPESGAARIAWEACLKVAEQQKKAELVDTANAWAESLDKLTAGGWIFLALGADGTYAIFGSHRNAAREGNIVSVWLRMEYREAQKAGTEWFKSAVKRDEFDCTQMASKQISTVIYRDNNLKNPGPSLTFDEAKTTWVPAVPGTLGDSLVDWACNSVPPPSQKTP